MGKETVVSFSLFDTAIGRCAIAWGARGVVALRLPEANDQATRAHILMRHKQAREAPPPPDIAHAVDAIVALTGGEARDLSAITLALDEVPEFHRRVYALARTIAPGATLTYGDIAARLGDPDAARAVGRALGQNPFAIIVPCHRVVAAGGRNGGFSAHGGVATKRRLLAIEAARPEAEPMLFDRHGGLEIELRRSDTKARRDRG
jgi:methylated-DNA-[protein]-cysteine S-methyltransferase